MAPVPVPKPPRIPPDTNFSVSNSQKNVSAILRVSNELSFFNQIPSGQLIVGNSIESIIALLKIYGLATPDMTQQGSKIVGTGYTGTNISQGTSVSLSGDGNTLAVGGFNDDSNIGATWIFIRSFDIWMQQGPKLVGTGYIGTNINQGVSVSLSDDGNTLAVGGVADNINIGATWVFTRSAGVWTQQGPKLVGSGYTGTANQGFSVSLSGDGNTLAVGGFNDASNIGATWVFTRSTGSWSQAGSKLVGTGYIGSNISQGTSVSLSDDGNTLAVGGYIDNNYIGAVWIFIRNVGVWTQQGPKLVGSGYAGVSFQGFSVSLSGEGNTLAVGGFADDNGTGATWVFTSSIDIWTQQGSKLVGTGNISSNSSQGFSVSLSDDGNTLAIGGPNDDISIGATWVFTRSTGSWSQIGSKLVGTGYTGTNIGQGKTVSLSSDGNTLAVGGPGHDDIGSAWVFIT